MARHNDRERQRRFREQQERSGREFPRNLDYERGRYGAPYQREDLDAYGRGREGREGFDRGRDWNREDIGRDYDIEYQEYGETMDRNRGRDWDLYDDDYLSGYGRGAYDRGFEGESRGQDRWQGQEERWPGQEEDWRRQGDVEDWRTIRGDWGRQEDRWRGQEERWPGQEEDWHRQGGREDWENRGNWRRRARQQGEWRRQGDWETQQRGQPQDRRGQQDFGRGRQEFGRGRQDFDRGRQDFDRGQREFDRRQREYDREIAFDPYYDYDWEPEYGDTILEYTEYWMIPGPFTGVGPRGYQRSDERIFEDVCERLSQHGRIDASEVDLKVESGEVTLTGQVMDRETKRMVEDVVEDIPGVAEVHNQLKVKERRRPQVPDLDRQRRQGGNISARNIRAGMQVVGRDGSEIGTVKEVRSNDFLVDRTLARDVYVPFQACQRVDDQIMLNIAADEIDAQNWETTELLDMGGNEGENR